MKKNDRLEDWLTAWETNTQAANILLPREYRAYFFCFNCAQYYEAHDVLEHLWLRSTDHNRSFYQALIQFAGAFVHFQKHAQHPGHPTHSRRLAPGQRLLALSAKRLAEYQPFHMHLDVAELVKLCALWSERAESPGSPLLEHPQPVLRLRCE